MHRSRFHSVLFSSLMVLAAACGSSTPQPARSGSAVAGDPSCPIAVPGTSVSVEDADDGAALVFVTTGDAVELRRRVAEMAKMHNEHHASMGALPDGKDAGGGHAGHDMSGHAGHDMGSAGHADMKGHDMGSAGHADMKGHDMGHATHAGGMIGVHSKAAASDIDGGAKLSFVAGGSDVAKLQSELRMHAQHMSNGTCTMGKS